MTIHEFGKENGIAVVLIHPSVVMWDYFGYCNWRKIGREGRCKGDSARL